MLCQTHPRVLGPRFHCHQARVRHIFLFFVFCPFFESAFSLLTKSGWSDCPVPRSLCLLSKWQLNSLDKRSQEGTGLRQSLSRQVISTTTPSLRHLFPETAWQCPLKLFLMQYFGMWSSEGGQAMCQKRGGAVLKRSRHYLSEQSAVFAKKRVISRPRLNTTTLSLHLSIIPLEVAVIQFVDSCMTWGLRKWSKWRQMKFTDSFKM